MDHLKSMLTMYAILNNNVDKIKLQNELNNLKC